MRIVQRIPILLIIVYDFTVCIGSGYTQIDCGPYQFRCDNGECIASELLCDGEANCRDSSDETKKECKRIGFLCPSSAFRCDYGGCINGDETCNGIRNCVDNSDEADSLCYTNKRQESLARRCNQDQYTCANGQQCVHIIDVCDGVRNCADGSDETFTLCRSSPCPSTAFRCAYGGCIDGNLQCNGINNCADNSDEDPNLCGSIWSTISPTRSPWTRPTRPTRPPSINTCVAPPQPENGHWKLHRSQCRNEQDCNVAEGTEMRLGSYLIYSCNRGYKITRTTNVICNYQGKWEPAIPTCTEIRCEALDTVSIRAECKYRNRWVSCKSPVPPETSADLSCENSYQPATDLNTLNSQRNHVICNDNGQWEPEPMRCIPGPLSINIYVNNTQLTFRTTFNRNNATLIEILDDRITIHTNVRNPNNPSIDVKIPKPNI